VEEESMAPALDPCFVGTAAGSWVPVAGTVWRRQAEPAKMPPLSSPCTLARCSLVSTLRARPRPDLLLGALATGGSRSRRPGLKLGVEMEWSRWACSSHRHHVNSVITTACALHQRISSLCGSASEPQSAGQSSEGPTMKPGRLAAPRRRLAVTSQENWRTWDGRWRPFARHAPSTLSCLVPPHPASTSTDVCLLVSALCPRCLFASWLVVVVVPHGAAPRGCRRHDTTKRAREKSGDEAVFQRGHPLR
jgi:hypothetical protein